MCAYIHPHAGLLPWAALWHCVFGIWMHTHFIVEMGDGVTGQGGNTTLSIDGASSTFSIASAVMGRGYSASDLWSRITSPNGIPLLACTAVLVIWLASR